MLNDSTISKLNEIFNKSPWFKKLEILRIAYGWKQEDAAERCGTSKRIYWNWENGICVPISNNRKFIAAAFGISEHDLFSDINEKAG